MIAVLWTILLVIVALCLPVAAWALQRLFKSARKVERYFREMETAARGIADHTAAAAQLDDTIGVASRILSSASAIDAGAQTLHSALAARAGLEDG